MAIQASLPGEKMTLPLQVETDPTDLSQEVASRSTTRLLWTGLGFAVLVLLGVAACSLHPLAVKPSPLSPEVAFHSMSPLGPGGSHPARNPASDRARPKAFRAAVVTGSRPSRMANQMSAENEAEEKATADTAAKEKNMIEKTEAEKMFAFFENWMGTPEAAAKEKEVAGKDESFDAAQETATENAALQQAADKAAAEKMFARFDAAQKASVEKVPTEKAQADQVAAADSRNEELLAERHALEQELAEVYAQLFRHHARPVLYQRTMDAARANEGKEKADREDHAATSR